VSDPGGFNLTAPSYQPLFKLWQDGAQQRQRHRGAEGAALSNLQMGGVAPHDDHAALEQQPLGKPPA
jgi:hypothetical protein